MTMQYTVIFKNFQKKMFDIFLIFAQNKDCGYTLEPPRRAFFPLQLSKKKGTKLLCVFDLDFSYKFSKLQHYSLAFVAGVKRANDEGSLPEIAHYSPYYLPLNVLLLPKVQTITFYLLLLQVALCREVAQKSLPVHQP